jgi:hypothetical protein
VTVITDPGEFSGSKYINVGGLNISSGAPDQIQVLTTLVPEPGFLPALAAGLVATRVWRRRNGAAGV